MCKEPKWGRDHTTVRSIQASGQEDKVVPVQHKWSKVNVIKFVFIHKSSGPGIQEMCGGGGG